MMKTYAEWHKSKLDLDHYLKIDDLVDDDLYYEMLNCMPPTTHTSYIMQVGEPSSHVNGKPTWATFIRTARCWQYRGDCFTGEICAVKSN